MSLPEPVRRRLNSFSRTVFTDNNRTGPENRGDSNHIPGEGAAAALCQTASYKDGGGTVATHAVAAAELLPDFLYSVLPDYYKFILVTSIILTSLIEVIRLYLGYMGNLQEKVPELAGFWLLSLLLQMPLILFLLLNEGLKIQPLERAVNIIFVVFLVFQVISAFLALKRMVNQLATRFHLHEFDRLDAHLPSDNLAWQTRRLEAPGIMGQKVEEFHSTTGVWGSAMRA